MDHTADVGLEVTASTPEELFARAALGMTALIQGWERREDVRPFRQATGAARHVALHAEDRACLLRDWLRELLFLHQDEGLVYQGARFAALSETGLDAQVTLAQAEAEPIREIKGVTLHGLVVERRDGSWRGRVIFDV